MNVLVLTVIVIIGISNAKKLEEKYSWKELDFAWPSEEIKQEAIRTGRYVEGHNLPLGLDVWKDKVFITVPRYALLDNDLLHFGCYLIFYSSNETHDL